MDLTQSRKDALDRFKENILTGQFNFEHSSCFCGAKADRLIGTRDRFALEVRTVICRRCGLMRTDPQMTKESLEKFYEDDYRPLYVGTRQASGEFFQEQLTRGKVVFEFTKEQFQAPSSEQLVFDIGCGAGGLLVPFQDAGCTAIGCDLGSQYLEFGRNKGLILEHGSSGILSRYGKANMIMLNHVLEHFKNPEKEIQNISELLTDDGLLYIELPGVLTIKETYGDLLLFLQNAHLFHFTLKTLSALMSRLGFELVKGNQNIQALFRKSDRTSFRSGKMEYLRIMSYLWRI